MKPEFCYKGEHTHTDLWLRYKQANARKKLVDYNIEQCNTEY